MMKPNLNIDQDLLRNHLGDELYRHSLGVADTAVHLADHYGADKQRAYLAGLLHDYAKGFSADQLRDQAERMGLALDRVILAEPRLLHAPVGAALLSAKMNITDAAILKAVNFHTTGRPGMALLEKIVYLADYIEPNRDYPGVEELRRTAPVDLDRALLASVEQTISSVLARGLLLHPRSIRFRNDLLFDIRKISRG